MYSGVDSCVEAPGMLESWIQSGQYDILPSILSSPSSKLVVLSGSRGQFAYKAYI